MTGEFPRSVWLATSLTLSASLVWLVVFSRHDKIPEAEQAAVGVSDIRDANRPTIEKTSLVPNPFATGSDSLAVREARSHSGAGDIESAKPIDFPQSLINDDHTLGRDYKATPTNYPLADAAKYFVPKNERRTGNLGGPPPLDFPGGPNELNPSIFGDDSTLGVAPPAELRTD